MNQTNHHPTRLQRFQEKLAASREWSISLALHTAIVVGLSTYVLVRATNEEEAVFQNDSTDWVEDSIPDRSTRQEEGPRIEIPDPKTAVAPPAPTATPSPSPFPKMSNTPGVILTSAKGTFDLPDVSSSTDLGDINLKNSVPKEMSQRFAKNGNNHVMPLKAGGRPGPTNKTEEAVIRGLNWLRDNQARDGSWGDRNKGAMTGLALLAFLGHGETGESPNYGLNVNRAIEWVLQQGTRHQGRLSMTDGNWGPGNGGVYEHGILTYALGEYYNLTKDERVTELYRQAVSYIVSGQGPDGGWMYHYDKTQSDTSVSGWQVQALKAAHLTKLGILGVDGALDRAMKNFDRVQGPNGGYGYRTPADRYSLSGVGLACELFWNGKRDGDMRKGVKFILDQTKSEPIEYGHEKADLYAWYYHTQGMLMFGGSAWVDWESKFRPMALASQGQDGSWPVMKAPAHGKLQTDPGVTGGVYRTALSVLMLESYYRYLHLNQAHTDGVKDALAVR